jgi:hypothetical protein
MGMHTWFYKDKELYHKYIDFCIKYDLMENDSSASLDELKELDEKIESMYDESKTEYHDLFRTTKREQDGTYIEDIIESKQECNNWIEENKQTIYNLNQSLLNEFWDKYPNGLICFS